MSWGGSRVGSGRKAKNQVERWLAGDASKTGNRGTAPSAAVTQPSDLDLEPPSILTPDEAGYWQFYAALAAGNGTLTLETRPGLALLCQVACRAARLWAQIEVDGFMYDKFSHDFSGQAAAGEGEKEAIVMDPKAHPLLTQWRGLISRQEMLLSRYGLAGSGKAIAQKEKPKADPFLEAQSRGHKLRAVK